MSKDRSETIECAHCGHRMYDTDLGREEMEMHEAECDGISDPRERFDVGDRVQFSDLGRHRLNREHTEGEVVGYSDKDANCVRVLWDHRTSPHKLAHIFVKPVDGGESDAE